MEKRLLSIDEAAKLLGVSRSTFNKIRVETGLPEVTVGRRARFYEDDLIAAVSRTKTKAAKTTAVKAKTKDLIINIFADVKIDALEVSKNVFDLTILKQIDPYGALSLLCTLVVRARTEKKIKLIVNDGLVCQSLKSVHFFYQLESQCAGRVEWDEKVLAGSIPYIDTNMLTPIHAIRAKGAERTIAEQLLSLLRKQGFNDAVGRAIAQIIGELADNAMTHSREALSERFCYVFAQRFLFRQTNSIIVGIADPGAGIAPTLKTHAKYKHLSDEKALLESFRPFVTSWDSARGKGLADVLAIALGNKSFLRADSGKIGLWMDFHDRQNPAINFKAPVASIDGTRFGLILIDNHFERCQRKDVDEMITKRASELS